MVSTQDKTAIEAACQEKFGLAQKQSEQAIKEAAFRITKAAIFNRSIEAGQSLIRLHDLYERSLRIQDNKTALQVQKEINRLVGLYEKQPIIETEKDETELATIREYLEPLGVAPEGTSVVELVRITALRLTEKPNAKN